MDYVDSRKDKLLTLSAEEFLRRIVQHVLPKGFMKIRHYGLLSSRLRQQRLQHARQLLLAALVLPSSSAGTIAPAESLRCPRCGETRRVRCELPRAEEIAASPTVNPS